MATIQKRNSSYRITVSCGYDVNGRQIRKTKTWNPAPGMTNKQIEKELERQAFLFEEKVKSGKFLSGNIRFSDFAEKWMSEYAEKQLKHKTITEYQKLLKRIIPAIGHIRLEKLLPVHLMELYNNLSEDGMNLKTGGKLTANSIRHYHTLISSILSTAVEWQVIYDNPALRVSPIKVTRKEAASLDEKETAKLLQYLESEPIKYHAMVVLALYAGLRRGEACGLEWKDINFENGVIDIRRSLSYTPEKGVYTDTPKNESSKRVISLSENVFDLLRQYRGWQAQERLNIGSLWENYDKLFTQWNGKPINPDTASQWFSKFIKRNNLPKVTLHSLRHTNATLLLASGVPIRTVASRLGHAQTSTTTNIYAHAIKSADEAAAKTLGDILSLKDKKTTG